MTTTRPVSPGKRRKCPHCRSEILESASICPACRHHLRFGEAAKQAGTRLSALHVEGTVRHPAGDTPWEYSVVIAIRNQKGEEVARQIVGIGAMQGADLRTFDLSVDVFVPETASAAPAASKDAPIPQPPVSPTSTVSAARRAGVKQDSTVSAARSVSAAPRQTSMISEARILPRRQTSTVSAARIISARSQKESASKEPASKELSKKELSKESSQKQPASSDKATNGSNRSSPRTPTKPSGS